MDLGTSVLVGQSADWHSVLQGPGLAQDAVFGPEVMAEPSDVLDLLVHCKVGVLGQAQYYQLHEVAHGAPLREAVLKVVLQKNMLVEGHVRLFLQA